MAVAVNPQTFLHTITYAIKDRLRIGFPEGVFLFALMGDNPSAYDLEKIVAKKPFLGLGLMGLKIDNTARNFRGVAIFNLFMIVENSAGFVTPADAKTIFDTLYIGDSKGVGIFGMLAVAGPLLHGLSIYGVGSVHIENASTIRVDDWAKKNCALAVMTIHVAFDVELPGTLQDDLNQFLTLNAAWSVNGDAEVLANDTPLQIAAS